MTQFHTSALQHEDYTASFLKVLAHAIWMTLLFLILPLIPFAWIWGLAPLTSALSNPVIILPALMLVGVHELLHAVGWHFAGQIGWREFHFGISWKTLSPYCHTRRPMSVRAYRIGTILPGIVLGIVPIIIATLNGDAILAILGGIMTAGAVGDVYVLWLIRNLPAKAQVLDHPSRVGCTLISEGEQSA